MIQHSNDILHNLLSWGTRPKKASAPPPVLIRMSRCLVAALIPVLPRCHPSCLASAYGYLFILSLHTAHAILALKPPCVVPATPCLPQYDHLFPFLFYPPNTPPPFFLCFQFSFAWFVSEDRSGSFYSSASVSSAETALIFWLLL